MVEKGKRSKTRFEELNKKGGRREEEETKASPTGRSDDTRIGYIKVFEGEEKQDRVYPLVGKTVFYAGRSSEVDIPVSDMKVSRKHCKIEKKGNRYRVSDLGSRNGTYLNGKRIRTELLSDGDQIRLGFTVLQFFLAEQGTHIVESKMKKRVCTLCSAEVPEADILSGKAEELEGNVYCAKCVESVDAQGEGDIVAATPADLKPPPQEAPTQKIEEKQGKPPPKPIPYKTVKEKEKKEESIIEYEDVRKESKVTTRSSQETVYDLSAKEIDEIDEISVPPPKAKLPKEVEELDIEELLEE
ncbi:MAG: FHA domain-containing protein [Planctomycetota bacterium]|nr:FHA domain-containing protein [Planctomycetota bacterium]